MLIKGNKTMRSRVNQRKVRSTRITNRREPLSIGYLVLTVACASLMAAGFFFVAVQHFVAMDLGFKNSTLRKQVDELEAEKRRLLLAKEVALSPVEVTRTAMKLGFREVESVIVENGSPVDQVSTQPMLAKSGPPEPKKNVTAIVASSATNGAKPLMKNEKLVINEPSRVQVSAERPRRVVSEREVLSRSINTIAKLR